MNKPHELYYLKSNSKQDMEQSLQGLSDIFTRTDGEGNEVFAYEGRHHHLDYIGQEVLTPPTYDSEGNVTTPPVMSDYVLANLLVYNPHKGVQKHDDKYAELISIAQQAIDDYDETDTTWTIQKPTTPIRKFAGLDI